MRTNRELASAKRGRPTAGIPRSGLRRWMLVVLALAALAAHPTIASSAAPGSRQWIGTWAAAPQPPIPKNVLSLRNQSLRLIVHTSAGGSKVRIRIANTFGDQPLQIGAAHIACRAAVAEIDPATDRALTFGGSASATVPPGATLVSDPVDLDVPPLADLAISLFFPQATSATTLHILARQSSYVSGDGDHTADAKFPVAKTIRTWPFLSGVEVAVSPGGAAIVAFGSSTTDGDGSSLDGNHRYPDALAERLQNDAARKTALGVLNLGIIGNRLLQDSPKQPDFPFGAALGQAGLARFDRDVLGQAGVRYVILALGINDIAFPGSFTPASEKVSAQDIISGYRRLIARAHRSKIRIIGTTIPPFEGATFNDPRFTNIYTPSKEAMRQQVNAWIRTSHAFDAVVDFDAVLRDPDRPTRLLPAFDSGDHLHMNDAGYAASAKAIPLALFQER